MFSIFLINCNAQAETQAIGKNSIDNNIEELLAQGKQFIDGGELDKALVIFERIISEDPENAKAYFRKGIVLIRKGKLDQGVELMKKAIILAPANIKMKMSLASIYEFNSSSDKAVELYKEIINLVESGSDEAKKAEKKIAYIKATTFAKQGQIDKALPIFKKLAEEYPEEALILYNLGQAYLFKRELDKAENTFKELIKIAPTNPNSYTRLASIYEQKGNLSLAIEILRKIVALDPTSPQAKQANIRLSIIEGRLLMQQGNLNEALELVQGVLEIDPSSSIAIFTSAEIYHQLGQLEQAEDAFKKVIELTPKHIESRFRLAGIYIETNRPNEGIALLEQVVASAKGTSNEKRAQELINKVRSQEQKQFTEADRLKLLIGQYQKLLEKEPDNLEAHFDLGRIYLQQGSLEEGRLEFEAVVRIDPDNHRGQMALASIYDELGLYDKAIEKYSVVIALEENQENADRLTILLEMAQAKKLYVESNIGEATKSFNDILTRDPDNAMAYFFLGLIHASEENMAKSVDAYEEVVRLIPNHVGARLNLGINYERLHREEDAISEYRKILQAGPPAYVAQNAAERLIAAEKRIKGLSAGFGYALAFDSNSNQSSSNSSEEFRGDLTINIAYQYKMESGVRLRFITAPTYSTYHQGQFDFLNTSSTISATIFPRKYTLVGGITRRTSKGLLNTRRFSDSNVLFAEGATRLKMPKIFSPFSKERIMSGVSVNLSYTDFNSESSPFFSAKVSRLGGSINQSIANRAAITLGYSFTNNKNTILLGNDYAYKSHGINISFEKGLRPGISANVRYGFNLYNYSNLDSFSRFTEKRRNTRHTISFGGTYFMHKQLRFYTRLSWVDNSTNLPIGFILNTQDLQTVGLQSSSLGDFSRGTLTTGMRFNF